MHWLLISQLWLVIFHSKSLMLKRFKTPYIIHILLEQNILPFNKSMEQLSKYKHNKFICNYNKNRENETFGEKDKDTLLVICKIIEVNEQTQKAN